MALCLKEGVSTIENSPEIRALQFTQMGRSSVHGLLQLSVWNKNYKEQDGALAVTTSSMVTEITTVTKTIILAETYATHTSALFMIQ